MLSIVNMKLQQWLGILMVKHQAGGKLCILVITWKVIFGTNNVSHYLYSALINASAEFSENGFCIECHAS